MHHKVLFDMNEQHYLENLQDIKRMMLRSSKFFSISGLSGILVGSYALVAAWWAREIISAAHAYTRMEIIVALTALAMATLVLALGTAAFFAHRKARKHNESFWDPALWNMIRAAVLPLITGGLFGLGLILNGYYTIVASATLVFYGLSMVAAARYTYSDIFYFGLLEILTGLVALFFPYYGLWSWAFGFGVLHILMGIWLYFKYDRRSVSKS